MFTWLCVYTEASLPRMPWDQNEWLAHQEIKLLFDMSTGLSDEVSKSVLCI